MSRHLLNTTTCKLCRKIYVGGQWILERREYFVSYQTTLCPECLTLTAAEAAPPPPEARRRSRPPAQAQPREHEPGEPGRLRRARPPTGPPPSRSARG